mmetsp:Transcript_22623/g.49397  ORF Transcript_22623/g.49397 Transcript_22623/m.49397 type:complete len:280 (-) Transcript_22623:49-888(-)
MINGCSKAKRHLSRLRYAPAGGSSPPPVPPSHTQASTRAPAHTRAQAHACTPACIAAARVREGACVRGRVRVAGLVCECVRVSVCVRACARVRLCVRARACVCVRGSGRERRPTAGLASASLLLGARARAFRRTQNRKLLDHRRVDADGLVKVRLCRAALHCDGEALRHLARARPANVESDDAQVLLQVADELAVAGVVAAVGQRPLKRLEVGVEDLDALLSIRLDRVLLGEADARVLQRRVDRRRDARVVHLECRARVEPVREEAARLDGDGSELGGV